MSRPLPRTGGPARVFVFVFVFVSEAAAVAEAVSVRVDGRATRPSNKLPRCGPGRLVLVATDRCLAHLLTVGNAGAALAAASAKT